MNEPVIFEKEMAISHRDFMRFLARALAHRENVLKNEPGCQRFDILVPREGGDTVLLYEVYADEEAVEAHMTTSYMQEYLSDTGPMITKRKRTFCTLANA